MTNLNKIIFDWACEKKTHLDYHAWTQKICKLKWSFKKKNFSGATQYYYINNYINLFLNILTNCAIDILDLFLGFLYFICNSEWRSNLVCCTNTYENILIFVCDRNKNHVLPFGISVPETHLESHFFCVYDFVYIFLFWINLISSAYIREKNFCLILRCKIFKYKSENVIINVLWAFPKIKLMNITTCHHWKVIK